MDGKGGEYGELVIDTETRQRQLHTPRPSFKGILSYILQTEKNQRGQKTLRVIPCEYLRPNPAQTCQSSLILCGDLDLLLVGVTPCLGWSRSGVGVF